MAKTFIVSKSWLRRLAKTLAIIKKQVKLKMKGFTLLLLSSCQNNASKALDVQTNKEIVINRLSNPSCGQYEKLVVIPISTQLELSR